MRNRVVRFQLFALAVLAVLVAGRFFKGLPSLEGELTILDIHNNELVHKAFAVDRPLSVQITAYGSLESEEPSPVADDLAAYPWIVRRVDRSLVWRMDPSRGKVVKGTLIRVDDTIHLDEGTYDLYYAAFGLERSHRRRNPLLRLAGHWSSDRKNWQVALRVEDGSSLREEDDALESIPPPNEESLIWASGPMRGHQTSEQLFSVSEATPISIYTIGEFCNGEACDSGWIANLETGDLVWKLTEDNSVLAGGSPTNRLFNGIVALEQGSYRAVYKTDAGHAFGDWFSNPPFDPVGWGMSMSVAQRADRKNVQLFGLWGERESFVSMTSVRDDQNRAVTFRVFRETPIVAYAMGELRSSGSNYDYGWIEDEQGNTIWQMSWGGSSPAGGSSDNRVEQSFLVLKPGRYVAHYVSDGSHSFEGWNRAKPMNPERWGLTLFLLDDSDADAISVEASGSVASSPAAPTAIDGSLLADLTRVGNDADLSATFTVNENEQVRVRALGEITASDRYDYGWIENEAGNVIWSMDRSNTTATGQGERLRFFDGPISLAAGRYTLRFKSDYSYAFGDFDGDNPARPHDYGIQVFRVNASGTGVND